MKQTFALALTVLAVAACGGPPTDAVEGAPTKSSEPTNASSSEGMVRLTFTGLEDGKGAAGLAACKLKYTLENGASTALKYATIMLRPVADPGDTNALSFIETRGDLVISMANIDPGSSRASDRSLEAMTCDRVKGIRIISHNCGFKPQGSCNEALVIENETSVDLVKP